MLLLFTQLAKMHRLADISIFSSVSKCMSVERPSRFVSLGKHILKFHLLSFQPLLASV